MSAWIEIHGFATGVFRDVVLINHWFSLIILENKIFHLYTVSFNIPVSNI